MERAAPSPEFTIFYDGACPLCSREMRALRRRKGADRIEFRDTSSADFRPEQFGISTDPNRLIHGMLPDGTIVRGMEVFRTAYSLVGLGWLIKPTGWPILRPIFDLGYRIFARHRMRISRLFGRRCDGGSCDL